MDGNAVRDSRKVRSHFHRYRLKPLIEHFLQVVVLPPRLGHMMIGEDLSTSGGEKSRPKRIQVHFRSAPNEAQERVAMFVSLRFATAGHLSVVQFQSGSAFSEGKHNVDKANTGLVRLDDRLRDLALGLELLKAGFYSR